MSRFAHTGVDDESIYPDTFGKCVHLDYILCRETLTTVVLFRDTMLLCDFKGYHVIDWRPVQGVLCLSPIVQPAPHDPLA